LIALLAAALLAAQEPGSAPALAVGADPPRAVRVLGLAEAVDLARARQPQLAVARASTEASDARADQARSPLLPQLLGAASYERTTSNFVSRPGAVPSSVARTNGSSWASTDFWQFSVAASQLVYDFGETSGRWRAARESAAAQRSSERAAELQAILVARSAFFAARATKDLVGVARETLANQEAHLAQIAGFVRAGTRPEIDLAQARTDRANSAVQLINAENGYAIARAQLAAAIGHDGPVDFEVSDEALPPVAGEDGALEALVAEGAASRPDLAALERQVRAQELTIRATQGGYAPALGISTGVTHAGTDLGSLTWNWQAAATLTWNLYEGGLTRAQEREARANADAARAQVVSLRQQVRLDVEAAYLAARAARSAIGAADEAVTNARERLRLAEGRYRAGVGSVIELGDAQLAVTAAAAQRVQASFNLATSRAQLLRALGRDASGKE
jgi:outer membrane protein